MDNNSNVTLYSEIFDTALSKLRDYDLNGLSQDDCYSILFTYLRPACVKFKVCRKNLKNRDNELRRFNFLLDDDEIEIIANEIVIKYIAATYINTPLLLRMRMSSKDFASFSQGNHLDKLITLHNISIKENEQLMSKYSWDSSSLFNSSDGGDET